MVSVRAAALIAAGLALAASSAHAGLVRPCGSWTMYKQCSGSWSGHKLGTGSDTICQAGCAMSSVAMALATKKEDINGARANPGSLNDWLTSHGGYADGDLIVWGSVSKLGGMHTTTITSSMSSSELTGHIKSCNPVIANVRGGSHWVLVNGYDTGSGSTFAVNDPGFSTDSYDLSGMSHFVVYAGGNMDAANSTLAGGSVSYQATRAILSEA